ncbi:MAG: hypothetical protein B6243_13505 [Anaerolineaceae bacterium 4572_5.2]|nr:MAG: hypothetical protein B6243_13505 [Anaerolineaceae bacterium 4572_5.2]
MSEDHVAMIIGRAVTDSAFRKALFANPKEALKEYDLTEDEKDALMQVKQEDLEDFGGKLDKRITKSKMW